MKAILSRGAIELIFFFFWTGESKLGGGEGGMAGNGGGQRRSPVVCHPEMCENAMCDESCQQVPKIISECRGSECSAEHPRLIYKVLSQSRSQRVVSNALLPI